MRTASSSAALLVVLAGAGLGACSGTDVGPGAAPDAGPGAVVTPPPGGAQFDYQIGEPYTPHPETRVVSRDRGAPPAPGLYNICYVNAFQAQPGELSWWQDEHPDLLLRDDGGDLVVDREWDEVVLDISTSSRRDALAAIVGTWIVGCAADGFDAVEPDNLDSYTRSGGLLTEADAAAFATLLAERAHAAGLAIGQKNDTDLAPQGRTIGFDFAVAEECNRWSECDAYVDAYGTRVLVVEYRDADYDAGCAAWPELSIVRRDVEVTGPEAEGYRYAAC
jgi:Glycoside-hydrolase family GH114